MRDFLDEADYRNYRNVRAVGAYYVVLGGIFLLGGLALLMAGDSGGGRAPEMSSTTMAVMTFVLAGLGATGVVGGVAAIRGNRKWSRLVYGMAALYLLAFPLGTILSVVMLTGLGTYLDNVERMREAGKG